MRYDYKVVPAPDRGEKTKGVKGPEGRFAAAVERIMNDMAERGWEYLRTDTLPSEERAGLTQTVTVWRNLLIFRRQNAADVSNFAPRMLTAPLVLDRPVVAGRVPQEADAARTAAALSPRRVERPADVAARAVASATVAPAMLGSEMRVEEDVVAKPATEAPGEAPAVVAAVVAPEPVASAEPIELVEPVEPIEPKEPAEIAEAAAGSEPVLDPRIAETAEVPQRISSARAEALKSVSPDDVERGIWGDPAVAEPEAEELALEDDAFAQSEDLDEDVWGDDDVTEEEEFEEDLWGHQATTDTPAVTARRDETSRDAEPEGDDLWDDETDETAEAGSEGADEDDVEEDLWGKAAAPSEVRITPRQAEQAAPVDADADVEALAALTAAAEAVAQKVQTSAVASDQTAKPDVPAADVQAKVEDASAGEDSIDGLLARLRLEMEPTEPTTEDAALALPDTQPPAATEVKDTEEPHGSITQDPITAEAAEATARSLATATAEAEGVEMIDLVLDETPSNAPPARETAEASTHTETTEAPRQASEPEPKGGENASALRPRRPQGLEPADSSSDEDTEAARLRMARKKRKRMEAKVREGQPVRPVRKVTVGENRIVSRGKVPSVAQRDPDGDNGVEDTGTVHSLPGALAARAARLKSAAGQN